jgi:hypothetical protein
LCAAWNGCITEIELSEIAVKMRALFYVAAHRTSALNLSIIQGAIPALVLIGARPFLGARFTALQGLGALTTMAGVVAIAAQGDLNRLAALAFNGGDVTRPAGLQDQASGPLPSTKPRPAANWRGKATIACDNQNDVPYWQLSSEPGSPSGRTRTAGPPRCLTSMHC